MKPEEGTVVEIRKKKKKSEYIVLENAPDRQFDELPRARFGGMLYYDFKNVRYISNCGMARFIGHVRTHLKNGVEIRITNIREDVKQRLSESGLDQVIYCN